MSYSGKFSLKNVGAWLGIVGLLLFAIVDVRADAPDGEEEEYRTRLFFADPDGSNLKKVVDLPEFQTQGSPCWSLDGKLIAFDAWKSQLGEKFTSSRTIVVNADGSQPRIFEDAAMPAFSPGGYRILVSRPQSGGVWVIDVDSADDEQSVRIDERGWGTDWARDGRFVYGLRTESGGNLRVVDIVEGRILNLFDEQKTPYRQMFWNMAWSPDGKRIAYKAATHDGKVQFGIVDTSGAEHRHVTRDEGQILASFAWSADGSHVLYVKMCPERKRYQIYSATANSEEPPKLLSGQDPLRNYSDIAYAPDGKKLLLTCHKPKPAEKP